MARAQFFENHLQPIEIDRTSLLRVRAELRAATRRGVELIESACPPPDPMNSVAFGNIFNGHLGNHLRKAQSEKRLELTDLLQESAYRSCVSRGRAPT
jgi:hypothetical protein